MISMTPLHLGILRVAPVSALKLGERGKSLSLCLIYWNIEVFLFHVSRLGNLLKIGVLFLLSQQPLSLFPILFWIWDNCRIASTKKRTLSTGTWWHLHFLLLKHCLIASGCPNRLGRWWATELFPLLLKNWAWDSARIWTQEPCPSSNHARSTN